MSTLGEVRLRLGLEADADDGAASTTVDEAVRLLPHLPRSEVEAAAQATLALAALQSIGLPTLLGALRGAAMSPQPERELVELTVNWTGGFAEIRASWGDTVASAGRAAGPTETTRLDHHERHVGTLTVALPAPWQALIPVLAEYALLARLRSAAAGAARRRVGERMLDALLSGQEASGSDRLGQEAFALAVATLPPGTPTQDQALDLLAAVGEGYFSERRLVGHATVRGGQAVWLWTTLDLPREARELHLALTASTALDVRLGVSGRHPGGTRKLLETVQRAFGEARQALAATRQARGHSIFHDLDALHALLSEGRLDTLAAQIGAQLAALNDDGRTADTLRAYLAHRGTLAELALALEIHVNTLRYRLRRAEEVLGGRLSDPALLARLYLAFGAETA
ncbi:CdaR family transcriptional regulator [Deinococcus sp. AJ005]|uniref:PucR family transcriptional regulator n=1 Tax=Deinococcus sp. AJ005 TaxID=2652443 RepID=UPI00125CC9A7|nr:helix-turn-helix domain-containing protein [Deinococcus sp. AJ005]QFP75310.1 PucR family transcriptional regulator [Deinococcus sp. AJ005]